MNWGQLHDMRESLRRHCEANDMSVQPQRGPWFTDLDLPSSDDDRPRYRCGFCGRLGKTYQDHCHYTGLHRGPLCPSCNTVEGMNDGVAWDAWRVSAPLIEQRIFYKSPLSLNGFDAHSGIHLDWFKSLSMVELIARRSAGMAYEDAKTEVKRSARRAA